MWIEDYDGRLIDDLQSAGFDLFEKSGSEESGLTIRFFDGDVYFDIQFYYRSENAVWTAVYRQGKQIRYVYRLFDLEIAAFGNLQFLVPSPPEHYLETVYGQNWRIPVRAWNYRYAPENTRAHGSLLWRIEYSIRKSIWRLRNRQNHVQPGPAISRTSIPDVAGQKDGLPR
ncbi:MAG: hypothetical protein ACTSSQ_03275 [Alphaproteobacteria bacterium]